MYGYGTRSSNLKMDCLWLTRQSPDLGDIFAARSSINESETECPPTPTIDEPKQFARGCLILGLRSAAFVGEDELRVRIEMISHKYSYVQLSPIILSRQVEYEGKDI